MKERLNTAVAVLEREQQYETPTYRSIFDLYNERAAVNEVAPLSQDIIDLYKPEEVVFEPSEAAIAATATHETYEQESTREVTPPVKKLGRWATLKAAGKEILSTAKERVKTRLPKMIGAVAVVLAASSVAAYQYPERAERVVQAIDDFGSDTQEGIEKTVKSLPFIPEKVNMLMGGLGDGGGGGMNWLMRGETQGEPTEIITYPGAVLPNANQGGHTFDESIEIGAQNAKSAIDTKLDAGAKVDVHAYSGGTVASGKAIDRIIAENGGALPENLDVTYYGSPNSPISGFFNTELGEKLAPYAEKLGFTIEKKEPQPGAEYAAYDSDFWANVGDKNKLSQLDKLAGLFIDGHNKPSEEAINNDDLTTTHEVNGETVHSVKHEGTQTQVLRGAERAGAYVSEKADAFGQAIAPHGEVGMPSPEIDSEEVVRTGAALIDEAATFNNLPNPGLEEWTQNNDIAPITEAIEPVIDYLEQPVNVPEEILEPIADVVSSVTPEQIGQAENFVQQVQQGAPYIPPVQEFIPPAVQEFIPPAPAPAPAAPAPAPYIPPVQEFIPPAVQELVPPAVQEFIPPAPVIPEAPIIPLEVPVFEVPQIEIPQF